MISRLAGKGAIIMDQLGEGLLKLIFGRHRRGRRDKGKSEGILDELVKRAN